MKKIFLQILGILLILFFFSPFPGGTLTFTIGLTLLVCSNLTIALFVQRCRTKWEKLDKGLRWIENKMGDKIAGGLKFTRPENDPRKHVK